MLPLYKPDHYKPDRYTSFLEQGQGVLNKAESLEQKSSLGYVK